MTTFPHKLADNIWVLGHSFFHCYLIRGQQFSALMEVGMSPITDTLISQLASLTVSPDYLIVSHPHSDHTCGLTGLKKAFPQATGIAGEGAGEGAAEFLEHPKGEAALIHEDRHVQ
jgi:2-aminobenzoylacetyl-CoA thioesterase